MHRSLAEPSPFLKLALDSIMPAPLPKAPNVLATAMIERAVNRLADHLIALDNAPYGLDGVALETMPEDYRLKLVNDARVIATSRNPRLRANAESRVIQRILNREEAAREERGEDFAEAERQRVEQIASEALHLLTRELLREAGR